MTHQQEAPFSSKPVAEAIHTGAGWRLAASRTASSWTDPESLLVLSALLLPALACLLRGDAGRAEFYARLALHATALKWVGWLILTRHAPGPRAYLRMPTELVVGLAVLVGWFYCRNIVGSVLPSTYSLFELRAFPWLMLGLLAIRLSGPGRSPTSFDAHREPLPARAALYVAFAATLAVTLWSVAGTISAPSQDGWFHGFIARVYLNDGLFYPHFNGGRPIFYVSGFGAINAITAAVSGLSVVAAHNLQHIFLAVVGLFMLTTFVATSLGRPLPLLHAVPAVLLNMYPLHNLPPDLYWTHGAQQLAPVLLIALPVMSSCFRCDRRRWLYLGMAAQALLALLILALNPTCAVFLLLASVTALAVNLRRATASGASGIEVVAVHAGLSALAALLILGADRYYSALLLDPAGASYMSGSHFDGDDGPDRPRLFKFSASRALAALSPLEPMRLVGWPPEWAALPGRHLAWLALGLCVASGLWVTRERGRPSPEARRLALAAASALLAWLTAKYVTLFFAEGITNPSPDALLLYAYLYFLLGRVELWLLIWGLLTAAACVYVTSVERSDRPFPAVLLGLTVGVLGGWWLPYARTHLDPRVNPLVPRNVGTLGRIAPDDIALANWAETELPGRGGPIGLASIPAKFGSTKLLFPIGASQALALYGQGYDFTFQVFDPSREFSYDEYIERVSTYLDAEWCLQNHIRYFHLPAGNLFPNHGLTRARDIGLLKPVRTVATSGIYEVTPLPWSPAILTIDPVPSSTHQIRWLADGTAVSDHSDAQLAYVLPRARFVHGLRVTYTLETPTGGPAEAQLFWADAGQEFVESARTARFRLEPTQREATTTILVHDPVARLRFDPDGAPFKLHIRKLELLVKPEA